MELQPRENPAGAGRTCAGSGLPACSGARGAWAAPSTPSRWDWASSGLQPRSTPGSPHHSTPLGAHSLFETPKRPSLVTQHSHGHTATPAQGMQVAPDKQEHPGASSHCPHSSPLAGVLSSPRNAIGKGTGQQPCPGKTAALALSTARNAFTPKAVTFLEGTNSPTVQPRQQLPRGCTQPLEMKSFLKGPQTSARLTWKMPLRTRQGTGDGLWAAATSSRLPPPPGLALLLGHCGTPRLPPLNTRFDPSQLSAVLNILAHQWGHMSPP